MFRLGHDEVVWIDSDLIATQDFRRTFAGAAAGTLVVAEEPSWAVADGGDRAAGWGLVARRSFPRQVNTCLMRVDRTHEPLLRRWQELLARPEYRAAQELPFAARPPHLGSDQDVLHALLASEFANVAVHALRAGQDIAQCHLADGYLAVDRLRHVGYRLPSLVHTQGYKPWRPDGPRPVYLDVSPYSYAARRYRHQLAGDTRWMWPRTRLGRLLSWTTLGEPNLAGLIPAAATKLQRRLRLRTRLRNLLGRAARP